VAVVDEIISWTQGVGPEQHAKQLIVGLAGDLPCAKEVDERPPAIAHAVAPTAPAP
jgi:hypothetical protein